MLTFVKDLFAEKVGFRAILRGNVSLESGRSLEKLVRSYSLIGTMRISVGQFVEISVEGPKPRLERLLMEMPTSIGSAGKVIEATWAPYKGRFDSLYVTWQR